MLDYIRIACAVPDVQIADPATNAKDVCNWIEKADAENCDVVVFPELALTGYTCADLFGQNVLLKGVLTALQQVVNFSEKFPQLTIVAGLPLRFDGQLYNCAVVIGGGTVRGIVPKSYIPDHGEFEEKRWFASGTCLRCEEVRSNDLGLGGEYGIPVGAELTFALAEGAILGVEICEDLWAPVPPSTAMALRGAEVIVNLAASNEVVGKRTQRQALIKGQSERLHCVYAFCSAGKQESTQDLLFSGHSMIAENGTVLAENAVLADSGYLLVSDADLDIIRSERQNNTSFRDACVMYGQETSMIRAVCSGEALRGNGEQYPVSSKPFHAENWLDIFHIQVEGLRCRLERIDAKPVIGISGGLDSTLALLVAAEAVRRLGRPSTDVHGLTLPCFGTTDRTCGNAQRLMELLGITAKRIDIHEAVTAHFQNIGHDPAVRDTTYENAQARERTQVLMDYAGRIGGIVVGTGDMSELALGWCTYNGDHMSMYGVNATVTKTQIPYIIRAASQLPAFQKAAQVLEDIIATPISPELLPPDENGKIAQQTEELVGPYELHDFFLYYCLRYGFTPKKIYALACHAFRQTYEPETIQKWLVVFYRRFFSQQFKRSCMPEGVKIGKLSLSPRGDWRMPSDACVNLWLQELDKI